MAYTFSIASDVLLRAEVLGFRGVEAISRPFSFQIAVRVDGPAPDPADLVHERLALEIRGELGVQRIAGVAASATIVHVDATGAMLRLELVPTFWRAGLSKHSRVFTDASVPQIVQAVLREDGVTDVDLRLVDTYPVREHVGQYRESNLAFVSRLLEREGIFYFFEHDGDTDRMVIADHPSAFAVSRAAAVRYRPGVEGGASFGEAFFQLSMRRAALPRRVQLTDWSYRAPRVAVAAERAVAGTTPGSIVRHGDHLLSSDDALRHARIRAEELAARETVFRGSGPVTFLVSGGRFTVEDHPRDAMNRELVAVEIEHVGVRTTAVGDLLDRVLKLPRDISYRATLVAQPAEIPFRPRRVTPIPTVEGVVDAIVDGQGSSPYAQIDEHGRYKVRLLLDEGDLVDGSRSTWVRMLQPHGGGAEGFHFPLRKKTEVHVAFTYGDPDRPVIVGVAHNVETPSVVTGANHTRNVIQTGGLNRIEMEDLAGAQRIDVSCPTLDSYLHLGAGAYQFEGNTAGEGWWSTGGDTEIAAFGDKTEDVLGSVFETYASSQTLTVLGAVTEVLATSRTTTVVGPEVNTWAGPLTETVTAPVTEVYGAGLETTVASDVTLTHDVGETLTVTGGVTETYGATQDTAVTGSLTHTVTGDAVELFGASSSRAVAGDATLQCDGPITIVADTFDGDIATWNTLDDATKDRIENVVAEMVGTLVTITGASASAHGAKVQLFGRQFARTVLSASVTGLSVSVTGVRTERIGPRLSQVQPMLKIRGASILQKGLILIV